MFYRERLKQDLERRKAKNPRYSLSALARDIGLTPAAVSLVLSGRRHFSRRTLTAVAKHLNWSDVDLSEALLEISRRPRKVSLRKDQLKDAKTAQVIRLPPLPAAALIEFQSQLLQFIETFSAEGSRVAGDELYAVFIQVLPAQERGENL